MTMTRSQERFAGWRDHAPDGRMLWVDVQAQRLWVLEAFDAVAMMRCSTAAAGLGEQEGSFRTPRGWHAVSARIGDRLPEGAILEGRRWTGRCWEPRDPGPAADGAASESARESTGETIGVEVDPDLILTRVLWLEGLEPGLNRGGEVDTRRRYIYIHGTNHRQGLGRPASHGCVRLACRDIVRLHDHVRVGDPVWIG